MKLGKHLLTETSRHPNLSNLQHTRYSLQGFHFSKNNVFAGFSINALQTCDITAKIKFFKSCKRKPRYYCNFRYTLAESCVVLFRLSRDRVKSVMQIQVDSILCPRLGAEWIGRISWLPRAPVGPIFMTGLYSVQSIVSTIVLVHPIDYFLNFPIIHVLKYQ